MAEVMVVEDDFPTRNNISQLLHKSGYAVLSAESGEEALNLIQNKTPDLIISDIMMPGIDGLELFRKINREDNEDFIPFIFLTGKTEITDFRLGMQLGADDYITKPFKAHDLLKSVDIRLKKNKQNIQKLESFKSSITRNVSHEFRTPLVPIISYSQMISENYWQMEPIEILEMTDKINSSGSWMLRLIEKFLLLVELEENINTKTGDKTSVKETINTCALLALSDEGRKSDVLINVTDAQVNVPESELGIILTELLDNAAKFSRPCSPIEITAEPEGEFYTIAITDYGKGMTQEQLIYLSSFLQFSREGMHRAGLGLGLPIVRKIAEKYGLGLSIDSQMGLFTKISLSLPLAVK